MRRRQVRASERALASCNLAAGIFGSKICCSGYPSCSDFVDLGAEGLIHVKRGRSSKLLPRRACSPPFPPSTRANNRKQRSAVTRLSPCRQRTMAPCILCPSIGMLRGLQDAIHRDAARAYLLLSPAAVRAAPRPRQWTRPSSLYRYRTAPFTAGLGLGCHCNLLLSASATRQGPGCAPRRRLHPADRWRLRFLASRHRRCVRCWRCQCSAMHARPPAPALTTQSRAPDC
ncbi:uncharacterized protein CC84DRAFT_112452 [Paraphaeosphaeria sporulosa]|uniref:Uncharacterized protein n=1 Tax=Paraphaeosphaeria sporulosa TaxID=1460663 RepID=A0A177CZ28_9PLEO|nr:uncharacterized protein CC84DRAFT_112452 [Paraphaeosphaeria sporulosa]OAG12328.1 hypothetical protein CC84DRAFT_112452 [Paraphaeosphaeria sporulosa]